MKKNYIFLFLILIICFGQEGASFEGEFIFPASFHKGVGLSAYQNGGHRVGYSNWSFFEKEFTKLNAKTVWGSTIKNNEQVGAACNFWENILHDIALLKELRCNAFRFSVEWADVEPVEGKFNQQVLVFYMKLIDTLLVNNITPMITLYHFVHPYWFERKGGFEKQENIHYFVDYCKFIFEKFGSKVKFWCTINEPTVMAACGYVLGIHPPGNFLQFSKSAQVLLNLLNAHVEVYQAIKNLPYGDKAQVGIVHQMLQAEAFDAQQENSFFMGMLRNVAGRPLAEFLNTAFAHKLFMEFFKTGRFYYHVPLVTTLEARNDKAPESLDFVGLNFYSKVIFGPLPTSYPGQQMTDMEYASRPEKLYDAIAEMATLNKPIYITENGIADRGDNARGEFITQHIAMVYKAKQDGFDVRGYYYWTLMDNFEWNDGYAMKFGLYHVDFVTQQRTLRPGSYAYRNAMLIAES